VFHIDEQPVEAGGFADGGNVGGARLPQAETGRKLALLEQMFGVIGVGLHGVSLVVQAGMEGDKSTAFGAGWFGASLMPSLRGVNFTTVAAIRYLRRGFHRRLHRRFQGDA
jgi:hypothetical protein